MCGSVVGLLMPGMKVTNVGSEAFSIDLLRRLVQAASPAPIRLTFLTEGDEAEKISIDDQDGLRFPHLKRR